MAALVISRTSQKLFRLTKIAVARNQPRRDKYIVLLPEIPDERKETNSLLQTTGLPDFGELTAEKCRNAVGKLLLECEYAVARLEEGLEDGSIKKEFLEVVNCLENAAVPLDYAWGTVRLLYTVKHNDKIRKVYHQLAQRVQKARSQMFHSIPIYHAMKEMKGDKKLSDQAQKRVVDKYILEATLNGINLTGDDKEHLNNTVFKLAEEKEKYRKNVEAATKNFSHYISHENEVKHFPDELKVLMAEDKLNPSRGPWKVTLTPHVYYPFLECCPDSTLRWNAWQAFNTRASSTNKQLNNSTHIELIRSYRKDQANILGFKTFADMSMETKMAGNIENALSMIATLHLKTKDAVNEQLTKLQEFAKENGFDGNLEPSDIPFWRRQQRISQYSLDDAEVRQYFPFPKVLDGLFALTQKLFGITFKEATNDVIIWNKHVRFFKIYDENDVHLGSFYLDPYFRPEEKLFGSRIDAARNRSDVMKTQPLVYLTFNFPPPVAGNPSLLSFKDVIELFQKFGHLLQHSISTIPYSDVSGITNLEWDVVEVCPYFLSRWLFHYETLASFALHKDTGNPLPPEMHRNLRKVHYHMAAYDLQMELYLGALDLELYRKTNFWLDITRNLWQQFMPFPIDKEAFYPCSFMPIFCGDYPAAYFSFKWAEMIAADAYSAFREAGDDQAAVKQVGRRFKETFLSLGGGCRPAEVFRRFRGRDPSPDALLATYGLKNIGLDVAQN